MALGSCSAQTLWSRHAGSRVRAWELWRMGLAALWHWHLPGRGTEPVSLALAGRYLSTAPPGKSSFFLKVKIFLLILFQVHQFFLLSLPFCYGAYPIVKIFFSALKFLLKDRKYIYVCVCVCISVCIYYIYMCVGFPHSSVGKESACNAGDPGLIPGSGISDGKGIGYPLQYSGLENSMDYSPWGHKEWDTTVTLTFTYMCVYIYIFNFWASKLAHMVKNLPANARVVGDVCLVPGLGRSAGGGNGNPLQYFCLKQPMDRGAWCAIQYMRLQRVR